MICSKIIENFPKNKLIPKLGQHYRCVPPIEEAFNSLQQFLQEDFPKLIKDIYLSSSSSLCGSMLSPGRSLSSILNEPEELPCGSFSALPVKHIPREIRLGPDLSIDDGKL